MDDESTNSHTEEDKLLIPNAIFGDFIDRNVVVKTETSQFSGICRSVDGYLNTSLENAKFTGDSETVDLKSCYVVGGSVKHINLCNE